MSFKKIFKTSKKAQAAIEYIILFAIFAFLCFIGVSTFFNQVKRSAETSFDNAFNSIVED
jgi:uncharacterized protein (UPF0333 family)